MSSSSPRTGHPLDPIFLPRSVAAIGASADMHAIVEAARAVSRCILEHDEVAEVEVNPLLAYAHGAEAVDARIFLEEANPGA